MHTSIHAQAHTASDVWLTHCKAACLYVCILPTPSFYYKKITIHYYFYYYYYYYYHYCYYYSTVCACVPCRTGRANGTSMGSAALNRNSPTLNRKVSVTAVCGLCGSCVWTV